jgi:hypothetical protein
MLMKDLRKLLNERDSLLDNDPESARIDSIREEVITALQGKFNDYPVDFMLETLTRLGHAPCLINDDNGMWALSGAGMQPVVTGKERLDGSVMVIVEKKMWKHTVRKAIMHYINN